MDNSLTKVDDQATIELIAEYQPTVKETALLQILLDPSNHLHSITRRCEMAGCSREFYYKTMRKRAFVDYYHSLGNDLLKGEVVPLIHAGIAAAKEGSFHHWKALLEMAGTIKDKKLAEIEMESGPIRIRFVDPNAED